MATQTQKGMDDAKYGVDDLTYDLVTILHQKSKGLEAYDQYIKDAQLNDEAVELLERIRKQDRQVVEELRDCLAHVIKPDGGM